VPPQAGRQVSTSSVKASGSVGEKPPSIAPEKRTGPTGLAAPQGVGLAIGTSFRPVIPAFARENHWPFVKPHRFAPNFPPPMTTRPERGSSAMAWWLEPGGGPAYQPAVIGSLAGTDQAAPSHSQTSPYRAG